jgi:hypothetical protein
VKLELQRAGQGLREGSLADSGHVLDEDVPSGDQGRNEGVNDF